MNEAFQVIFGLLGGLSIFLFGMNMMSESLQKAAGEKMKKILGILTGNPILLGDNIGTTITALLACIGQSRDAKRTALAHCTFNVSGALLFIWFVKPYAAFIQMISTKGPEVEVISRQIANAHTIFNVTMTLIWLPLIWLMVKIVTKLVPDMTKVQALPETPVYLDFKMVGQPAAALEMVAREILRCGTMAGHVIGRLEQAVKKQDLKVIGKVQEEGLIVRKLYDKIIEFLASLFSSGVLTEEQATQTAGMMYVLGDMERTDALSMEAADALQSIVAKNHKLSEEAVKDLKGSLETIEDMYDTAMQAIRSIDGEGAGKVIRRKDKILELTIRLRKNHMKRVKKGSCNMNVTRDFMQILHSIDRIGNSCANIAEATTTGVSFESFLRED